MAKLPRKHQKVFGQDAAPNQIGVFGSFAAGAIEYSSDPDEIQKLQAFSDGWFTAIQGNDSPSIQDMNSAMFLAFYQLTYILERGIPEWSADTEYDQDAFVSHNGEIFKSKVDTNEANTPVGGAGDANWEFAFLESETQSDFLESNQSGNKIIVTTKNIQHHALVVSGGGLFMSGYATKVVQGKSALSSEFPEDYPSGGVFGIGDAFKWSFTYRNIASTWGGYYDLPVETTYTWNGYFWEPPIGSKIFYSNQSIEVIGGTATNQERDYFTANNRRRVWTTFASWQSIIFPMRTDLDPALNPTAIGLSGDDVTDLGADVILILGLDVSAPSWRANRNYLKAVSYTGNVEQHSVNSDLTYNDSSSGSATGSTSNLKNNIFLRTNDGISNGNYIEIIHNTLSEAGGDATYGITVTSSIIPDGEYKVTNQMWMTYEGFLLP